MCSVLFSCMGHSPQKRLQHAEVIAQEAGLQPHRFKTKLFTLTAFGRIRDIEKPVRIYIEGDGRAFISRNQVSRDPTPTDPVALSLAAADSSPNVFYLARPCQYIGRADVVCDQKYWTSHRYSAEVVQATNQAINQLLAKSGVSVQEAQFRKLELIGFSGGGTIAALVAAQRKDVAKLITVAGNLNTDAHSRHHRVSRLHGSLNPVNFLQELSRIPQTHFVGGKDKVVPPFLARNFVADLRSSHRSRGRMQDVQRPEMRVVEMPEYSHHCCWEERWPLF